MKASGGVLNALYDLSLALFHPSLCIFFFFFFLDFVWWLTGNWSRFFPDRPRDGLTRAFNRAPKDTTKGSKASVQDSKGTVKLVLAAGKASERTMDRTYRRNKTHTWIVRDPNQGEWTCSPRNRSRFLTRTCKQRRKSGTLKMVGLSGLAPLKHGPVFPDFH